MSLDGIFKHALISGTIIFLMSPATPSREVQTADFGNVPTSGFGGSEEMTPRGVRNAAADDAPRRGQLDGVVEHVGEVELDQRRRLHRRVPRVVGQAEQVERRSRGRHRSLRLADARTAAARRLAAVKKTQLEKKPGKTQGKNRSGKNAGEEKYGKMQEKKENEII